jgi:flagellar basal body-associated protein FliL
MSKERSLTLVIVCATVVLLSVAGMAAAFAAGIVFSIDGLLLVMISLMMLAIFALMLFFIAQDQGWVPGLRKKAVGATAAAAPAPRPAKAAASDEVQPNQATHPVDQAASRPAMQPAAKAGEGK